MSDQAGEADRLMRREVIDENWFPTDPQVLRARHRLFADGTSCAEKPQTESVTTPTWLG